MKEIPARHVRHMAAILDALQKVEQFVTPLFELGAAPTQIIHLSFIQSVTVSELNAKAIVHKNDAD